MKGNNQLILNQATMIEAVQFWLNAQMVSAPTVTSVAKHDDYGTIASFKIETEKKDEGK